MAEEKASLIDKYQVGDAVEGEVTGIVDFGVFVKLGRTRRTGAHQRDRLGPRRRSAYPLQCGRQDAC